MKYACFNHRIQAGCKKMKRLQKETICILMYFRPDTSIPREELFGVFYAVIKRFTFR